MAVEKGKAWSMQMIQKNGMDSSSFCSLLESMSLRRLHFMWTHLLHPSHFIEFDLAEQFLLQIGHGYWVCFCLGIRVAGSRVGTGWGLKRKQREKNEVFW